MIHISLDKNNSAATGWAASEHFPWPTVLPEDRDEWKYKQEDGKAVGLMKFMEGVRFVPNFILVNAEGEKICSNRSAFAEAKILTQGLTNSLGMKFVPVAGTDAMFCVYETRVQDYAAYARAGHGLDSSWKDVSGEGQKQGLDHPVVNVSWEDAKAFCRWLSAREGRTYRLPTDHEWSVAAGIGYLEGESATPKSKDGIIKGRYPWGKTWPPTYGAGNYQSENITDYTDTFPFTAPVGSLWPNPFSLFDMGGNVSEWCEDKLEENASPRVLRGGSWSDSEANVLVSSFRSAYEPDSRSVKNGFRCVLEK